MTIKKPVDESKIIIDICEAIAINCHASTDDIKKHYDALKSFDDLLIALDRSAANGYSLHRAVQIELERQESIWGD